jgi:hypothetical protein
VSNNAVKAAKCFPTTWPFNCPPQDAIDASSVVFRVTKSGIPAAVDFLSWAEMGKQIDSRRACECHGVSVFRNVEDAQHYADKYPWLGEWIARGALNSEHGKLLLTPRIVMVKQIAIRRGGLIVRWSAMLRSAQCRRRRCGN